VRLRHRARRCIAAGEGSAEDRPQGPPQPPGQRRDGGARQQHGAAYEQQDGEDAGADLPEEVGEAGFDSVADLAPFPAEEEDEGEVDAEGDQEERDQVEMALLESAGQAQPGFCFRLPFRGGFSPAG
jgi:hypothetical protein